MKTFIKIIAVAVLAVAATAARGIAAENTLFTGTVSTFSATDAGKHADINLATVKVKSITLSNPTATAQRVTIYKNANSTTTIAAVCVVDLPATIGLYKVEGLFDMTNTFSNSELVNIPYIGVRTSTNTASAAATVNVKYWN